MTAPNIEPRRLLPIRTALALRRKPRRPAWQPWERAAIARIAVGVAVAAVALIAIARDARSAEDPATRPGWAIQLCPAGAPCFDLTEPMPGKTACAIQIIGLKVEARGARLSCQPRAITAEASR